MLYLPHKQASHFPGALFHENLLQITIVTQGNSHLQIQKNKSVSSNTCSSSLLL